MLTEFRSEATKAFAELHKAATFLTVHHYVNNFGEVSDFSIVFHVNYRNAVARSLEMLGSHKLANRDVVGRPYTLDVLKLARMELLESFQLTLQGNNISYSGKAYSQIDDGHGFAILGVKLHDRQDILHINGLLVYKNVLVAGNYPEDGRELKTIAKDDLRKKLPVGRYRQFKLTPGRFDRLVVRGLTLREEDVVRQVMKGNI